MDSQNYTIVSSDRKKGQHLRIADRGAIQVLNRLGYSNRAIAKTIGCSPSTVSNELKRGTPLNKSHRGRPPVYSAKRGQDIYETNRSHSRKPLKINVCQTFITWAVRQIREHKWSLDACCGYARLHRLFSSDLYSVKKKYKLDVNFFHTNIINQQLILTFSTLSNTYPRIH